MQLLRCARVAVLLLPVLLILYGGIRLAAYRADRLSARREAEALHTVYAAPSEETAVEILMATEIPQSTATPAPRAAAAPLAAAPIAAATQVPTAAPGLPAVAYPDNPRLEVTPHFKTLRKQNANIVGWLTIRGLLDEPVGQRDNAYFLSRDITGRENANGALFLDMNVSLQTRPYTMILYGHNMKSGAMFGCLRNYEDTGFYRSNPLISFDTMYESGCYAVFAEGVVSVVPDTLDFLNFYDLLSTDPQRRQAAIDVLYGVSRFTASVDVRPEDQILLLVTCDGQDYETRRVLAARRLRPGETEQAMKAQAAKTKARY